MEQCITYSSYNVPPWFREFYLEDSCQNRVLDSCSQCLNLALVDYVDRRLGSLTVDDILSNGQSTEYSNWNFFQFTVQKKLLEKKNFEEYVKYISKSYIGISY
ncbi:unnamed protein product [Caretta caretta]